MRRAERIVFALAPLGEAAEAATLAQRADAVAAPGQDLVRIALMPDVPDQPVARRIENIVDRVVSSTTPSPEPRWPPVVPTAEIVSCRSSSASWRSCSGFNFRSSSGVLTVSSSGVSGSSAIPPVYALRHRLSIGSANRRQSQSAQRPRTSITGRTGVNPAACAADRTPRVTLSSSRCTVRPQESHTRKMQSCRQSGCALAT